MWETTFPRNSHAGLGRPFYERNILTSMKPVRKVPTQSGVAISRKCCFPHGSYQAVLKGVVPGRVKGRRTRPLLKGVVPGRVKGRNRVLTPSQSTTKTHARYAVPFSKIFVWCRRMPLIPFFRQSPRIAATISSNNSTWLRG